MRSQTFWEKTYHKNIAKMIGVNLRYVGDRAVAEDLAHDAILKAIEKSGSYRHLGSFEGWLMRLNLNNTLDYLRRQPQFFPLTMLRIPLWQRRATTSPRNPTSSPNRKFSMPFAPCPNANGWFSISTSLKNKPIKKSPTNCRLAYGVQNDICRKHEHNFSNF